MTAAAEISAQDIAKAADILAADFSLEVEAVTLLLQRCGLWSTMSDADLACVLKFRRSLAKIAGALSAYDGALAKVTGTEDAVLGPVRGICAQIDLIGESAWFNSVGSPRRRISLIAAEVAYFWVTRVGDAECWDFEIIESGKTCSFGEKRLANHKGRQVSFVEFADRVLLELRIPKGAQRSQFAVALKHWINDHYGD